MNTRRAIAKDSKKKGKNRPSKGLQGHLKKPNACSLIKVAGKAQNMRETYGRGEETRTKSEEKAYTIPKTVLMADTPEKATKSNCNSGRTDIRRSRNYR